MVSQELSVSGWTIIASGPITNILLQGIPDGWSVAVGSSPPGGGAIGLPVTSLDGTWSSNVLAATDNVYGQPWGRQSGVAGQIVAGMKN